MIWDKIILELKRDLSPEEFSKVKNINYDEANSNPNKQILKFNNIFMLNWIKRNYLEKIAFYFEKETNLKPKIELILNKTEKKESNKNYQITQKIKNAILNPSYSFENFVVGESNKFAYQIALKIAQNPGTLYNPFFLSGGTGLGKTHLLNAIGNLNLNKKNVILVTSEEFLNDFINHLMQKNMQSFKEKYRNCDFLLIDDIQLIGGKEKFQEEFFHTFNILKENNRQIVLTSDKPVKELVGFEERLKSRFENGIVAQIKEPELETKIAIIKKKCQIDLIQMSDEIIEYIALNINNNIRTIEGILTTINSFSMIMNQEITLNLVENTIKNYKNDTKKITLDDIIKAVANNLNIKPSDIKTKKTRDILFARKIVIFLSKNLAQNSTLELAKYLNLKNHSSISKSIKKIQEEMQNNKELKNKIEEIKNKFTTNSQFN